MASRALIIAIEDYPKSRYTAPTLTGTVVNADKFAALLERQLGICREHILFCCSGESEYRTHGTTRPEIKEAVLRFVQNGVNQTEQSLVFLSGHGVMKPGQGAEPHTDILLCSDFVDSGTSGDACVQLSELTMFLSRSLGAGTHLWFVDACRTVDPTLIPTGLGLNAGSAASGTAGWFQLLSAPAGTYAANDSRFVDTLIRCLDGGCELERDSEAEGYFWIMFRNIARAMEKEFARQQRGVEVRIMAEQHDCRIRSIQQAGPTGTILGPGGRKVPPVELLKEFEEVIFLGDTNGQLPKFLELAFADRQQRRWKRLDVLSIEDLSELSRPGISRAALEQERQSAEDFLNANAARMTDELALYRYDYVGTYGSLWTASDGRRRVHVSPRVLGVDIRIAPSSDFIDFPANRHPTVDLYFRLASDAMNSATCRCTFRHPEPREG